MKQASDAHFSEMQVSHLPCVLQLCCSAAGSRRQLNTHPRQLQGLRVRASRAFHAAVRKMMLKVSAGKSGTDEGTCQSLRREVKSELDFEAPPPE